MDILRSVLLFYFHIFQGYFLSFKLILPFLQEEALNDNVMRN